MSSEAGRRRFHLAASALSAAAVSVFVLSSCNLDNGILRRAGGEYYPLIAGTQWRFLHPDQTPSVVVVRGDSIAHNSPCTVVEDDYQEQYVTRQNGEVRRFIDYQNNYIGGGTDYPLEQSYRLFYVLPFVAGNSWQETFLDSVPVLGDTFVISHSIAGRVVGNTTLNVQAGRFPQCYEVDLSEKIVVNLDSEKTVLTSETTHVETQEWFAPGLGVVKRIQDTLETPANPDLQEELSDYQIGGQKSGTGN